MQFGVLDHLDISSGLPLAEHYETRIRLVEALDRAGFYAYHVTEHHGTPLGGSGSPSVLLSTLVQRTKSIRLGTMVYALPTHHPLRLIEEICLLDQFSRGRLDIGFGRGSVPFELTYFGIDPEEARARYDEALEVVLQGLQQHRLDFAGRYFKFPGIELALTPYQRPMPPRWYGVHSVESAENAARASFNIVCNQPSASSSQYIAAFRRIWAEVRPSEPEPHIGLSRSVYVAPTRDAAIDTVQRAYGAFLNSFRHVTRRHGVQNRVSGRENDFLELMAVGRGFAGTPDDVADALSADLQAAGANFCSLHLAFGDLSADEILGSTQLFVDRVMPRLSASAPARSERTAAR